MDKISITKLLGCLMQKPTLLLNDKYKLNPEDDFDERFHKIIYSVIANLVNSGIETIAPIDIDSYLSSYDIQHRIFSDNRGIEYLTMATEASDISHFDYYYKQVKKSSLLKQANRVGISTADIYNKNVIDPTQREAMIQSYEQMSIDDILNKLDERIIELKTKYANETCPQAHAGDGLQELVDSFEESPEFGFPLQSKVLTTIARGARLKKLYLRSAATSTGKTRLAVGDACTIAIPWLYNLKTKTWDNTGWNIPTLFITTELEIEEINTMVVAFISGVPEWKILDGDCNTEERQRVNQAISYIKNSSLWICQLENFSVESLENKIKEFKIKYKVQAVFFDYIFSSLHLLSGISGQSRVKLAEHNILYILTERLKHLCNKLKVFCFSATQVNDSWKTADFGDASVIAGSKAIANKIDFGYVMVPVTTKDRELIQPIMQTGFYAEPNLCCHIYKNRRGKVTMIRLYQRVDLDTNRTEDVFMTDVNYQFVPMEETEILKAIALSEKNIDELNDGDVLSKEFEF